jgi:hypothetical protein
VHAPLGLRAARAYSKIAPDSPHAQHMTAHIFLALGMWDDEVAANETAIRLSNPGTPVGAVPNAGCGHYLTWLAYGYLQQGRFADARGLVESCGAQMRERPRTATGPDVLDSDETSAGSFSAMRARHLIDTGDWSGPIAAMPVRVEGVIVAEYTRDFADAYGATRHGEARRRRRCDRARSRTPATLPGRGRCRKSSRRDTNATCADDPAG